MEREEEEISARISATSSSGKRHVVFFWQVTPSQDYNTNELSASALNTPLEGMIWLDFKPDAMKDQIIPFCAGLIGKTPFDRNPIGNAAVYTDRKLLLSIPSFITDSRPFNRMKFLSTKRPGLRSGRIDAKQRSGRTQLPWFSSNLALNSLNFTR